MSDSDITTPTPSLALAFSENQQQISTTQNPIMPQNENPEQPHPPTALTLETEQPQNSDPPHQMEVDPNQDDVEMISPVPENVFTTAAAVTPAVYTRRGPKRKAAQIKKRAALEKKCLRKLEALNETLKPIPFKPINKTLDFLRHESLLKRVGLWNFVHMEFNPSVRTGLVAQLIANYNPGSRGSNVNGVKILVNRADLARALGLPIKRDKSSSVSDSSVEFRDEKESEESIKIVEEIVSNWMFLHGDTWCMPEDVVKMMKPIKEGNLEKMDWAGLIWYMMEKELSAAKLENCYYASYMQCLIKHQKAELLREEVKVDLVEDCDGDVNMSDRVDDVKTTELEEHNVELSLGQKNTVGLKEIVVNEENENAKEGNVNEEKEVNENEAKDGNEAKEVNENEAKDGNEAKEGNGNEVNKNEAKEGNGDEAKEGNGIVANERNENEAKEGNENEAKEGNTNVEKEGNENVVKEEYGMVEEVEKEDVEKEVAVAEDVINFEENEYEEDNGELFLDGRNAGMKEPFLKNCTLGDVESMDFEEKQTLEVEEGEEEEEEEEEEEPEQEQGREFVLSIGGETLEGISSASLIQGMEAVDVPFTGGLQICGDDITADFLGSRVDTNAIPGSSSHFGHSNKREIDHENEVPHRSHNVSNKRLRTGGTWENKSSSEFDMCLDQCQDWMGKVRMMYMEKEQACTDMSMNQQLLINELHKQEATIQHLQKSKFEEQQRRQREVYRLERELFLMTDLLDGYRKALNDTRNAFAEYRARSPQLDVPLYKDVPGGGGLMLSTMELEKQRVKQEEEDRMNRLLFENKIKDFEAECMAKFEAHKYAVESLNDKLLDIENQIEPLKELLAKRKVSESSECAVPSE